MKITNHSNVPDSVFKYLTLDVYTGYTDDPYAISATELLKPIQEIVLSRYYHDKLEVDAMDLIWKVSGTRMHMELAKVETEPPKRMSHKINDKWTVHGEYDHIENDMVWDYKETSVFTLIYKSREDEWVKQLSIYRWLHAKVYGHVLSNQGKIVVKCRDWRKGESSKAKSYYPKPIEELTYTLIPLDEIEEWIRQRVVLIDASMEGGYMPLCTDSERWYNAKTGVFNKCAEYCNAREFCTQNRPELTVIDGGVA